MNTCTRKSIFILLIFSTSLPIAFAPRISLASTSSQKKAVEFLIDNYQRSHLARAIKRYADQPCILAPWLREGPLLKIETEEKECSLYTYINAASVTGIGALGAMMVCASAIANKDKREKAKPKMKK